MYEPDYENISSHLSDSEIYSTLITVNKLDGDNRHNHASTSLPLEHENSCKNQNDYASISLQAQFPEPYSMLTTMNKLELENFCTDHNNCVSTSLENFCIDNTSTSLQLQPSTDENNFHYDNYCTDQYVHASTSSQFSVPG
ncbi:12773_t:CDS:2 [Gigaspora rosea]|nr:12773_t:CDS:2 [Gigaspora rosea]